MNATRLGSLNLDRSFSLGNSPAMVSHPGGEGTFARLLNLAKGNDDSGSAPPTTPAERLAAKVPGVSAGESRISAAAGGIDRNDALYEQCKELEIFVVKILIEGMRNTVQKSGLIDSGFAGKMYEDMLYDEYARSLVKNAGFGLADQAYLELSGRRGRTVNLTL